MKKKIFLIIFSTLIFASGYAFNSYSLFKINGLYGIIDNQMNIKVPAEYKYIAYVGDGFFCEKEEMNCDIYNSSLQKVYSSNYMMYRYGYDSKIYFKDKSMNECIYDIHTGKRTKKVENTFYSKSYFFNHKKGLVIEKNTDSFSYSIGDDEGRIIASNIDQGALFYSEGLMAVIFYDGRSGFVDETGKLVINTSFYIYPEDLKAPRKEPSLYYSFNENLAIVRQNENTWKIFDKNGNDRDIPNDIKLESNRFSSGLTLVSKNVSGQKLYGYMSKDMIIEIPCEFDNAENFRGQYACVVYKGNDGIIDTKGNIYLCKDLK